MEDSVKYYPVSLDIRGRNCLVAGGGAVGARKAKALIACGGLVTVVSPDLSGEMEKLSEQGLVKVFRRGYRTRDLAGMFLVISAAGDAGINEKISKDAAQRNILCNIVDRPKACSFVLPAVLRQKDLVIAVSTSGKSPALARRIKEELALRFGPEYGALLDILGGVRKKLLSGPHAPDSHKVSFEALLDGGLLELLKAGDKKAIEALLAEVLGRR